jgi:hypothetical protein
VRRTLLRFLDWQGNLLKGRFTPGQQLRAGVIMVDVGAAFMLWFKWSGEKFGVFTMSALALIYTGVVEIAKALEAMRAEEDSS